VLLYRTRIARKGDHERQKDRRQFGYTRKLPSGRWQASYVGPDLVRHTAPVTFDAKIDAEAWLTDERRLMAAGSWIAPKGRRAAAEALLPPTLGEYAAGWLRSRSLRDRTRHHYQQIVNRQLGGIAHLRLNEITPTVVREWYTELGPGRPTLRAHAYGLLRTIMGQCGGRADPGSHLASSPDTEWPGRAVGALKLSESIWMSWSGCSASFRPWGVKRDAQAERRARA
jgi:hypothetical protein